MKVKEFKSTILPGAWIVNPKDKGRKSSKNSNIFLDDGEIFEIEIFNPLKESVLSDIRLNGSSICKSGLVIKPGQRVYLDCFVDDGKKFIFKTYKVEDTKESIDAIADNGLLEVFFYKEQAVTLQNWNDRFHKIIIHEYKPVYYPLYPIYYPNYYTIGDSSRFSTGTTYNNTSSGVISNFSLTSGNTYYNSPVEGAIETGRIEKGEKSNQQFFDINMEFEKNYINHLVYKILPSSRKPKEINKISKSSNKIELKDILKRESEDIIELIKKLSDLHSFGILTDEEFSNKKEELLSKI
jgi:hypothetical protein